MLRFVKGPLSMREVQRRPRALVARKFILKDAKAGNFICEGGQVTHYTASNGCVQNAIIGAPFPYNLKADETLVGHLVNLMGLATHRSSVTSRLEEGSLQAASSLLARKLD